MKYVAGTPDNWDKALSLSVEGIGKDLSLVGPCPRCSHPIRKDLKAVIGAALAPGARQVIALRCNCDRQHEGAPPAAGGCGAFGGVALEL
jgi:hypothetical protein